MIGYRVDHIEPGWEGWELKPTQPAVRGRGVGELLAPVKLHGRGAYSPGRKGICFLRVSAGPSSPLTQPRQGALPWGKAEEQWGIGYGQTSSQTTSYFSLLQPEGKGYIRAWTAAASQKEEWTLAFLPLPSTYFQEVIWKQAGDWLRSSFPSGFP